ncbi:MAG: hypothetical protein KatS3mg015_2677 [Fimbriimonadales bacterium]|nr:MAG: hypothetical protein KatS3mg015_2677 [Fimbriimonadales bacterium]
MNCEPCEIVEELVVATSSCPATDVIMVQTSVGNGSSTAMPGVTQPTITDTAGATSQVTIDAYAMMINVAHASSDVSPTLVVTSLLSDAARGRSSLIAAFNEMAESVANAEDEIAALDVPQLLLSAAQATSSLTANTVAVFQANEAAKATSSVALGLLETAAEGANASSMVVLLRRVEESVVSNADGTDEVVASSEPQVFLLLSSGEAASMVLLQSSSQLLLESTAEVSSDVWYKDPGRVAWLMNTETTAVSWYDNFDFESIAQPPGKVLAVGPDGLYELTGDTDSGERIDAEVVSGFTDFGVAQTKRVDNLYFGYTSDGRISVTTETYESGHPPFTYFLEQRAANAPRNSRVTPGKGLWGRYWRMTIRNVDGADFEVHDAAVDIAVSTRRV